MINNEEAALTNGRLKTASSRGFAVDNAQFKHVLSSIGAHGRKKYKTGIPSDEVIRTYQSQNNDITDKQVESKEHAKLAAKTYAYIDTFFAALDNIQLKYPEILLNANRV